MRGNRLSVSALSALRGLKRLEELDLSNNLLLGPMSPNLLPQMPKLHFLTVSENGLVNVQQGALMGLRNLTYLSLSHNQVSVVGLKSQVEIREEILLKIIQKEIII